MARRWAVPSLLALALVGGCGSSSPSRAATDDASIKQELLRGVGQIRALHDRHELNAELARILMRLRRARGSTVGARARELAIQGFEATIKGTRSQLDFSENDSGEVAAATRDAKRADRYLTLGANRLRAAGRLLGIQVGKLNQH
jgi:hypothetical protein